MDVALIARGLIAGLIATAGMTLIELAARSSWGLEALLDWQLNQATAARVWKRPAEDLALVGLGFHFLHGMLAGLALVLVLPFFPPGFPILVFGLGYGLVLFGLTLALRRPVTRHAFPKSDLAPSALAVGIVSHLVYGAALALLLVWP